jgi:hypothetical protein
LKQPLVQQSEGLLQAMTMKEQLLGLGDGDPPDAHAVADKVVCCDPAQA